MGVGKSMSVLAAVGVALASGCVDFGMNGDQSRRVTLNFAALVGDEIASCGTMYEGLGTTGERCEILDLRMYVCNIRLINAAGEEVPLTLEQDGKWQFEDVALLDFENATGGCGDSGTTDVNARVVGTAPTDTYTGVAFDVGVPFELNHDDLVAAAPPMNVSAMFWVWALGHKFVRVDLRTDEGTGWNMHLGSTMCETDGPMSPPVAECARPNVPTITLGGFDPDENTIVFDVLELFASSDLTSDTPDTASGCQTFPDDVNECTSLFPNLGMDFATGACVDGCADQRVFRVGSADLADSVTPGEVSAETAAAVLRGQTAFGALVQTIGGSSLSCATCHVAGSVEEHDHGDDEEEHADHDDDTEHDEVRA